MKIFLDSANLQELESCLKRGCISGVTTNPTILSKEPKTDFMKHIQKMADLCKSYNQVIPLSVEVFTTDPEEMVKQAHLLVDSIDYENLNIKVPIGWDELEVIHRLTRDGIAVNCTCIFNEGQSILAAQAGAEFISIFMGRLKDIGGEPLPVIQNVRNMLDENGYSSKIIVGSVRHPKEVVDAHLAGGHIVTTGMKIYEKMAGHPQTDLSVEGFLRDFKAWMVTS
jgi:transaldolase